MEIVELLVKKRVKISDCLPAFLCIFAMLLFMALGRIFIPGLLLLKASVLIVLSYLTVFLYKRSKIEFDYCYFQGELDVAKVFNKSGRKKYDSFHFKDVELIAPYGSSRLDLFKKQGIKTIDISSQDEADERYSAVLLHKGSKIMLIIQAEEKLLDAIYRTIPSKFFRD